MCVRGYYAVYVFKMVSKAPWQKHLLPSFCHTHFFFLPSYPARVKLQGMRIFLFLSFFITLFLQQATAAHAYIGPGAGFALVSSFFILIAAVLLAAFTILTLPVRTIYLYARRRKIYKNMKAKRVIVLGFDGMDPRLCEQYFSEGKLHNLRQLKESGTFNRLQTTTPSISPVAWSTFATGVNPGKHNIFDFFTRNPKNYQAVLSSALIKTTKRVRAIGPFRFPVVKNSVKLLRKSTSFWKILGDHKIFSTVLRVPITFPPEKFYGACLSAMCAPDLRGTQGSFTLFTTHTQPMSDDDTPKTKGTIVTLDFDGTIFKGEIPGPEMPKDGTLQPITAPFSGCINRKKSTVTLTINGENIRLQKGVYSPWIQLPFKAGGSKKIPGIARFLLLDTDPEIRMYMTPINIDPESPTMPISSPNYYSICLAKLHGPFATLGLAEDTWALNEEVINEQAFLNQAYAICAERETAFLDNLRKSKDGVLVCVFDTTDRIQHMFFRYLDKTHPANEGRDTIRHKDAIREVYERSDKLVGQVLQQLQKDDLLFVISDHGFDHFKWGINLNTWLWQEGYLVLKDGEKPGAEWFANVDWKRTRAYAFGLAGIFINTKGRERDGIIKTGPEKLQLLAEIKQKLEALRDPINQTAPVNRVILAHENLSGPYVNDGPDIFPGFVAGYRVSWNSAVGKITDTIIEPNTKHWSGDHCLDPALVPGVIFSNRQITDETPSLMDLAPTILDTFGIAKPKFQDGKVLQVSGS